MRMGELSRVSDVSVPSIKYYLRQGLLPAGERSAPNQAEYDQRHVQRLRLIRALIEVGGLSVTAVGDLLTAVDSPSANLHQAMGMATAATLATRDPDGDPREIGEVREKALKLIEQRGWQIDSDSSKVTTLIDALTVMYRLGTTDIDELVELYADTAERLGQQEVNWAMGRGDRDSVLEGAVVGTFVGGAAFNAIRTIVHESVSRSASEPDSTAHQAELD